jgi:4-hydroxy-L-threonine phosphate dehydrogenase PdxA
LKKDFGINKPKIAVLALNPHAGDEGLVGKEEEVEIIKTCRCRSKSTKACYDIWPLQR